MPSPEQTRQKHFSMIRSFHLADFFTIANGFCGTAAIFAGDALPSTAAPR